jgi:hypothetical protein
MKSCWSFAIGVPVSFMAPKAIMRSQQENRTMERGTKVGDYGSVLMTFQNVWGATRERRLNLPLL